MLPLEEMLKRKKLQWLGHVRRMKDVMPKKALQSKGTGAKEMDWRHGAERDARRNRRGSRDKCELRGTYLPGQDRVIFTDGKGIGVRKDYNGVLLLDTILQTPVNKPDDLVKLELLLSEEGFGNQIDLCRDRGLNPGPLAQNSDTLPLDCQVTCRDDLSVVEALLLQQSLRCVELPGVDQTSEVLQELCVRIKEAQANTKKGTKAQKWNTVCLELPHCALKCVCSGLVQELKRQNRHIPALTIASAINERLNCLLPLFPSEGAPADRALMFSEAARRDTFVKWPHMNYNWALPGQMMQAGFFYHKLNSTRGDRVMWALPDQMAQAGFYHQPNSTGDDRAMCFTCNVCLVCWEPTDEPWSEHERHSPACPFVKGEYTQNVPLSVTYATSPATPLLGENEDTSCIGTSSVPDLVATATRQGFVSVWNVCRQLKKEASFLISPSILNLSSDNPRYSDIKPKEAWPKKVTDDSTVEVEVPKIENLEGFYDSLLDDYLSPAAKCHAVELTALSVIGRSQQHRPARHSRKKNIRPCVVAGVSFSPIRRINSDPVWGSSPMWTTKPRQATQRRAKDHVTDEVKSLYLVVYDFPYHTETKEVGWDGKDDGGGGKGQAGSSAKKIISGTGTSTSSSSGSRQENNNMYHEIFLSKLMYDVPVIEEVVDSDIVMAPPPECLVESLNFPTTSSSGGIYPPPTAIATSGTYDAAFSAINGGMDMFDVCPSSVVVKVSRVSKKEGSMSSKREVEVAGSGGALPSKKSVPLPSQCIALPNAYASRKDLSILGIHPTKDGGHILVVLGSKGGCCDDSHQSSSKCSEFHPMTSNFVAKMMCEFSDNDSDMEIDGDPPSNSDPGASLRSPFSSASLREQFNSGKSFSFFQEGNLLENNPKMLSSSNCRHKSGTGFSRSALLVYSLNFDGEVVKVSETPINVQGFEHSGDSPIEVTLLPLLEKEDDYVPCTSVVNPGKGGPQGLAALVCQDGVVRILDVPTLKVVSKATPDKEGNRFVSAAYCNSLERLCALADKGSLHFFVLSDEVSGDCFEEDTASRSEPSIASSPYHLNCHSAVHPPLAVTFSPDGSMSTSAPSPTGSTSSSGEQLLVNRPSLGLPELQSMLELTRCENLSPCYAATVPPCWSEMMQAQKQRRHPQHLQQGDELQHTRSWRLQNDASVATPATWDEHVFELTLPRSCCVGHVDIKFSLHAPCPTPPLIQVTLLKQNASGIGRKEKVDTAPPVDQSVDFNLNMQCDAAPLLGSKGENPVMCEQYLRDHNTEILCGPVNLSSCLDLSDHSGIITLTSPKLFRIRGRTLLLHIKALVDDREVLKEAVSKNRGSEEKGSASKKSKLENTKGKVEQLLDYYLPVPGVTVDRLATAASSKKMEYYLGCDWLHEISITIRRTKQTTVTNERTQRCAMLESNLLAEKLVRVICQEGPDKTPVAQSMALDILIWVASVRLSRHRSCRGDVKTQQMELVRVVEGNLVPLVKHCIIMAGRSVAHKCVKLIIICSEGMKNALDCTTVLFDGCVLQALLEWLPMITCCWSAGALRWYFLLLSRVMSLDVSATTGQKCVSLLLQVAQELRARTNPYHLLLQTRFGLYNTPFEPELFDTEPPVPAKSTSVPITYASVVSQDASGAPTVGPTTSASASGLNFMGEALDLRELLGLAVSGQKGDIQGQPRLKGLTANHYMKGLLEVEPLHFTCHAASDGTKMEKIEIGKGITPGSSGAVSVPVGNLLDSFNFIPTSSGTKKADNDFISFYEDLKKSEEAWNGIELKFNEANNGGMVTYGSQEGGISVKLSRHNLQFGSSSGGVGAQGGGGGGSSNGGPEVIQIDTDTSSTSSSQQSSFTNPAPIMYQEQAPTSTDKKHDNKKLVVEPPVDDIGSLHLSWQQLLAMPAQHMLVIERMHSGARRFVVLDFGRPVLLTDLMIPACGDLVSLSIDMWCHGEETDGQRLVVASDIGTKSLVMSDLQPPPICRYLKITTIGRYGMSTTRCKIPIGLFYGHIVVLRGEGNPTDVQEAQGGFETNIQTQLLVLSALLEDIHCRYNLSCSKLQELLAPLLTSEIPNVVHMHHFLQGSKDTPDKAPTTVDDNKIITAYQAAPLTLSTAWTTPQSMFSKLSVTIYPLYSAPVTTPLSIGSLDDHYRSRFKQPMGSSLFLPLDMVRQQWRVFNTVVPRSDASRRVATQPGGATCL
uniref:Baculoviral IAP repeat-containing protein 6 n=1 Tax=Timema tahoe TaxID=61484 RepID=A0A7R9IL42_9NEOP|nr:unnamed protein product [Timema tahoe]